MVWLVIVVCLATSNASLAFADATRDKPEAGKQLATPKQSDEKIPRDRDEAKRTVESSRNALSHGPKVNEGTTAKPRKGFDNLSAKEAEALVRELQKTDSK